MPKTEKATTGGTVQFQAFQSPFGQDVKERMLRAAPANNVMGLCSIEDYSGTLGNHNNDLSYTHEDAQGFYNYMHNFYTPNFWFKDGGVMSWEYEEPYDHWQNFYGVDAVLTFYHSGHGNMDANGVFQAPMGGKWGNEGWIYSNHNMHFANQVIRYIFWSTCLSCRVAGGITPVKTWWADDANPGFRMLFGFETTSVDSGDYGSNFWNHWKNGESFSTAWLNASWDIYHNQSPSCVASGADQNDATSRLFNERLFSWGAVARNWYQWRWYYASSKAERNKALPRELKIAEFEPETFLQKELHSLAAALDVPPVVNVTKDGALNVARGNKVVALNSRGHLNATLGVINQKNTTQLQEKDAIRIAEDAIKKYNLHAGQDYQLDMVRLGKTAGSGTGKGAKPGNEYVTDTTVQFRQTINGIPTVNSDAGVMRVTVDNDGTVIDLHSSVRKVAQLHANPKAMPLDPKSQKGALQAKPAAAIEDLFAKQLSKYPTKALVKASEEVGYDAAHPYGRIVSQRVYEVTMDQGLKKLIKVTVPVFE